MRSFRRTLIPPRLATFAVRAILIFVSVVRSSTLAEGNPENKISASPADAWVGRYSQCSFNALSSVLTYFYGPASTDMTRDQFEASVFRAPLDSAGYGAYFGWAPWTGYMVESRKMVWSGHPVTRLKTERFSLRTAALPLLENGRFVIGFAPGERESLRDKLLNELRRGPVVIWTPYAAAFENKFAQPWHQISRLDDRTDAMPFYGSTHSVTLFLLPREGQDQADWGDCDRVLVTDCSVRNGVYVTDPDTLVDTSAVMAKIVRRHSAGEKSILERGLNGVENDEYNVVFFESSTTQPTTQPQARRETETDRIPGENEAIASLQPMRRQPVIAALNQAADRRALWVNALRTVPSPQRDGLAFLLANMPQRDIKSIDPDFVLENVALAYQARDAHSWGSAIPQEIFLDALLPYANLNELRDHWRPLFANHFGPLVKDCKSASEAALLLNKTIFEQLGVKYHPTKRPKPDQCPSESIAVGYASCTGLSILLVDACRAVGVPARVVGTPLWVVPRGDANGNHAGNHTWVEIWDGQWHVLGASEISPLDQTWFLNNASMALDGLSRNDGNDHHIYAACWHKTGTIFPLPWNPAIRDVNAQDVTATYAHWKSAPSLNRPDGAENKSVVR